ncbi:DNA repair photolyase [Luteibacter jiangsuensis]|uniref:DNA repair photolyase n=1 Tax=Luteibacter jiangsuensis TaxID=637577 RepID=A0ABT9STF5_9GAMM|nr:hypothetical protein [Luteibacter jiangsuensis]MDQ0008269.1 DNA repair photolyase [Luteibacter jiangsuensis]
MRLPHELKQHFREWLESRYPDRAAHIISLIQQMNGRKDYDNNFCDAHAGAERVCGHYPQEGADSFEKAKLHRAWNTALDTSRFVPPRIASPQGKLF